MLILFFSSLSLAALAGLLALNSAALKAAKARQAVVRTPTQEKRRDEELERICAQRNTNAKLHGATAVRNNAHKATCEAEIPVPGYVPVWAYNGILSVIIYVAPDNVDGRAEERRQKAAAAAWEASLLGRASNSIAIGLAWVLLAAIALILLAPLFFLFAGLGSTVGLVILIAWCLNDFKNDVADEVVRRQKSAK